MGGISVVLVNQAESGPVSVHERALTVYDVFERARIPSLDTRPKITAATDSLRNVLAELGALYAAIQAVPPGSTMTAVHDYEGVGAWSRAGGRQRTRSWRTWWPPAERSSKPGGSAYASAISGPTNPPPPAGTTLRPTTPVPTGSRPRPPSGRPTRNRTSGRTRTPRPGARHGRPPTRACRGPSRTRMQPGGPGPYGRVHGAVPCPRARAAAGDTTLSRPPFAGLPGPPPALARHAVGASGLRRHGLPRHRPPVARRSHLGRRRAPRLIDDRVAAAIAEGVRQIVLLGGGFDSRPYRLAGCERLACFEVDHPSTQARKRQVVGDVLGAAASRVRFAPTDFIRDSSRDHAAGSGV